MGLQSYDTYLYDGYSLAVERYAEHLRNNIELNSIVKKVEYTSSAVTVTYTNSEGTNVTVSSNKAVITVPLGVLKTEQIENILSCRQQL